MLRVTFLFILYSVIILLMNNITRFDNKTSTKLSIVLVVYTHTSNFDLPITVKFSRKCLVGDLLKSARHLYSPGYHMITTILEFIEKV